MGRDSQILRSLMFGFVWSWSNISRVEDVTWNSWLIHYHLFMWYMKNSWLMQVVKNVKTLTDSCEIYINLFQLIHWFETTSTRHFDDFNGAMTNYYGTDFSCMRAEFLEEQRKWPRSNRKVSMTPHMYSTAVRYYLQTGMFVNLASEAWKWRGIIYLVHLKSLKYVEILFRYRFQMIQIRL